MNWLYFIMSLFLLPILLRFVWILLYRHRRKIKLPNLISGILARGIISSYRIETNTAKLSDYLFIIVTTVLLVGFLIYGSSKL